MQLFTHFDRDDTAHVSIQLSGEQYASLRLWMHTAEGKVVEFLHGVRLLKRGFGWFRMEASKPLRAIDKLKTSLAVFNKWHREFEQKRNQELRLLLSKAAGSTVTHFSTVNHAFTVKTAEGQKQTVGLYRNQGGDTVPQMLRPAPANKLAALAAKFSHRR